jgi:hypothetical protein
MPSGGFLGLASKQIKLKKKTIVVDNDTQIAANTPESRSPKASVGDAVVMI